MKKEDPERVMVDGKEYWIPIRTEVVVLGPDCPEGTLCISDERKELQRKDDVCLDSNVGQENVSSNSQ